METKKFQFQAELKTQTDGEEGVFEGYASTFGNTDTYNDIVEKGAFANSLKKREPKVLWQHDMSQPVGKLLEAYEDEKGLYVKVKLATKTTLGKDAYEYMKAGIIDKLSIGFMTKDATYDTESEIRTISEVDLYEFSLVTIPANEKAEVTSVKSVATNERDFERFLRDNGYTRTEAKAIVSHGIKGYQNVLRDAGIDAPDDVQRDADGEIKSILNDLLKTLKGENNGSKGNSSGS